MKAADIEKKQLQRLHVLYLLYSFSHTKPADLRELAYKAGIKNGSFESALNYLTNEKWVRSENGSENHYIISHEGIKAIEAAVLNPSTRTDYFPPFNELDIKE